MDITNTLVLSIALCLVCVILREIKSDYANLCVLAGAIIILLAALSQFDKILSFLSALQAKSGLPNEYGDIMIKILGICILGDLSISLCRDQHHTTLGDALEMFCKCSVMVLALPIFEDVLNMIGDLLG